MSRQPVLFVSHGAPVLPLQPGATGPFWHELGRRLPTARAILVISAHWDTAEPTVSAATQPATIHDFYGFPAALYQLQYPAPGAPDVAALVQQLVQQQGIATFVHGERGLDHGAWVPLLFLRPQADLPVLQLSIQANRDPAWHYRIGTALQPLREQGVLIVASGSSSHNLHEIRSGQHQQPPGWLQTFRHWLITAIEKHDSEALLAYRRLAPEATRNHPSDEHLLPLFVALGFAGNSAVTHHLPEITFGTLPMDSWLWQD